MRYQRREELICAVIEQMLEYDLLNLKDYEKEKAIESCKLIIAHELEDYKLVCGAML